MLIICDPATDPAKYIALISAWDQQSSRKITNSATVPLGAEVPLFLSSGAAVLGSTETQLQTSLPLLGDPPRQEQNPGNVSYAELQLGDTCLDNQHRAKPRTLAFRLSRCIRPHPDLGCLCSTYTLQHSRAP
ncbi:hypothetical protein NQZ68_016230 [Dissostichus eleginoides]|nr:hypothetical protein NQZ68_016230 [Dissostichus eleginoides]